MTQKKKTEEESRTLHIWEAWPAEFLDPFRTPKQIEEARRRRRIEHTRKSQQLGTADSKEVRRSEA